MVEYEIEDADENENENTIVEVPLYLINDILELIRLLTVFLIDMDSDTKNSLVDQLKLVYEQIER